MCSLRNQKNYRSYPQDVLSESVVERFHHVSCFCPVKELQIRWDFDIYWAVRWGCFFSHPE